MKLNAFHTHMHTCTNTHTCKTKPPDNRITEIKCIDFTIYKKESKTIDGKQVSQYEPKKTETVFSRNKMKKKL